MSLIFQEVIDHLSCSPEVKTMPVACANIRCVTAWNMRYQAVTRSRLSWLSARWCTTDGEDDCYSSVLSTEAFLFFGGVFGCGEKGGMPIRQLELTVPCARAHMGHAWHFKSLGDVGVLERGRQAWGVWLPWGCEPMAALVLHFQPKGASYPVCAGTACAQAWPHKPQGCPGLERNSNQSNPLVLVQSTPVLVRKRKYSCAPAKCED